MTVNETTVKHVWETVTYGAQFENVRGVSFQPMFLSGRNTAHGAMLPLAQPITSSDVIVGLHDQSAGKVAFEDFTPLPCGDPNCSTIGWLFRLDGGLFSPTSFGVDIAKLQSSISDKINYNIDDLKKCGCDDTPLGDMMRQMEVKESHAFRLFIKPFMDARTWDEDRIDRCCTHVIRPDGKLDSFCRYYFGTVPAETHHS